ncbi:MAG: aspartate ammonia-lyase [Phycisphaerae bacterium]
MTKRTEIDSLGEMSLPKDALHGIHTARALTNFRAIGGPVNPRLIRAYGFVKLACARANAASGYLSGDVLAAIEQACEQLSRGEIDLPPAPAALQGGAGTSTNMYVNELLANRALELLGKSAGSYSLISPLDHINLHQSTNDTYPTALRVAAMFACRELEQAISELADAFQRKEREFAGIIKLGRTQLRDAVPMTLGQSFGAYAEALSKDRWRIYKCQERLRVVNLGGTAIGTGTGAERKYIFAASDYLRQITSLPIARAENMVQATQNIDEIVEVSGFLKALATNLFKISADLRLLSSGPEGGFGEINLPRRQAGSSIMPGKVNPVIAEMVSQAAMDAIAKDSAITLCAMNGQLELNAFMPLVAHSLLGMLDVLIEACRLALEFMTDGITANEEKCAENVHSSTAVITAFLPMFGYEKCAEIAKAASEQGKSIKRYLIDENLCDEDTYNFTTSPEAMAALGFRKRR